MIDEDVAVTPLSLESASAYSGVDFIELNQAPAASCSDQFRLGVFGYLYEPHYSVGKEIEPAQFLTRVGSKSDATTTTRIHTEFDLKAFDGHVIDRNYVPEPNELICVNLCKSA